MVQRLLRWVVMCGLAAALIGLVPEPAFSSTSSPIFFLSPTTTSVGDEVTVHGVGFGSEEDVSVMVCGDGGLEGAQGCDLGSQATLVTDNMGSFSVQLSVLAPPVPCPCVVEADSTSVSLRTAITITGMPSAPLVQPEVALGPKLHVVEAVIIGHGGWESWFGWPARRTLRVKLLNTGGGGPASPTLALESNSWIGGRQTLTAPSVGAVSAGQTRVLQIPVDLGAFATGEYTFRGELYLPTGTTSFKASDFAVPWGLVIIAALILQALLLLLRNRLRSRLTRREAVPANEEEATIDLTDDALQVMLFDAPVETAMPADPWTVTTTLTVFVPERSLSCSIEQVSCPSLGLQSTRAIVWDEFSYAPWEALHDSTRWEASPSRSGDENRIEYEAEGASVDVLFIPEYPGRAQGPCRLVEAGRVIGHLTLDGDSIIVSGKVQRERSWRSTPESKEPRTMVPFAYATTESGTSFGTTVEGGGWLILQGRTATLVEARREVEERKGPYAHRIRVALRDSLGRTVEVTGTTRNGMAARAGSGLALSCLTEWEMDGVAAIGEDREVISVEDWRAWRRRDQPRERLLEL